MYDESYSERTKHFGYTFEMVEKEREKEVEKKQKNFWEEFKRFICCRGGNEMDEVDDISPRQANINPAFDNKSDKDNIFVFNLDQ